MDQSLINRIVEAALLAATQPLTLAQLHGLFPEDDPAPEGSVEQALQDLADACADRGVELVEVASGYRYQVKADVHAWVARLWTERKTKYTRATLETLALIAYRQPITRGEIEQVRGVAVSSNIIQALEEREWIRVVGHRDVPGKPALFGTTKSFLDYFGLKRLDELPPLSELKDIGELEPQLPLDGAPLPVSIASGDAVDPHQDDDTHNENTPVADDDGATDDQHHDTAASDDADDDTPSDDAGDDTSHHDEPQPEDDDAAASDQEDRAPSEQKQ
ncbi:SMC-Scp complex subunit ScpB [Pseudoxanthomonas sp. LH2527]|uniref:SMC-Scp complex subunit ScpB n=1 Tax=Pseudoxanthomonas sp. LH2527 TaxID=2923249 RepID=UPI001F12AB43|nr:SMC-Scp complex subunit ScpB [Pseudoxanthomonas sp. LH2527]MCH6483430.1 SMC-Scp complex subunit ScpB [Pseudoxanthomonas sp. LH2527]